MLHCSNVNHDVFEAEGIAHLVSEAEAFFEGGRIDVLVNNAGGLNLRGELCDDVMTEELVPTSEPQPRMCSLPEAGCGCCGCR